ncbi:YxiJ family protein [Bacillus altitudinis]|uniref:YxiJ family protein n=1 Tax=Bacillus altitudinis TaxID=293387 RepID=UPI003CF3D491
MAGSLSCVIDNKWISKRQLKVLQQSFEEQYPQNKAFQHILYYMSISSTMEKHENCRILLNFHY